MLHESSGLVDGLAGTTKIQNNDIHDKLLDYTINANIMNRERCFSLPPQPMNAEQYITKC